MARAPKSGFKVRSVFDEGDGFGDGVNVASRLQGLSEPGGICISDIVHQSVADRWPRAGALPLLEVHVDLVWKTRDPVPTDAAVLPTATLAEIDWADILSVPGGIGCVNIMEVLKSSLGSHAEHHRRKATSGTGEIVGQVVRVDPGRVTAASLPADRQHGPDAVLASDDKTLAQFSPVGPLPIPEIARLISVGGSPRPV
jgi:hypothetical protein